MIMILFFVSTNNMVAQKRMHDIKIDVGQNPDSLYVPISDSVNAKYNYGKFHPILLSEFNGLLANKHWFSGNLISNGNHTHNALGYNSVVNRLGTWDLNFGNPTKSYFIMDSITMVVIDSTIQLKATKNMYLQAQAAYPLLWLDGVNDKFVFTSNVGDYRFANIPADNSRTSIIAYNTGTGQFYYKDGAIHPGHTPSAANDTGVQGTIVWDGDYIYVCVATNTWKRVAISSWP